MPTFDHENYSGSQDEGERKSSNTKKKSFYLTDKPSAKRSFSNSFDAEAKVILFYLFALL